MSRLPIGWRGAFSLVPAALLAASAVAEPDPQLAAGLQARTQAMVDAIAKGDKNVWDAALDPGVIYVDENQKVFTKTELLLSMAPLPAGLSGQIRVAEYKLDREGSVAVATYINDGSLDYHGQFVRTKFRVTDTWIQRGATWKLIGSQTGAVLDDPKPIDLPAATLADYAGQYELTYDLHTIVTVRDGKLIAERQDTRKPTEVKAEAADIFFTPGSPRSRKIFLRDAKGAVIAFVDRREGHDIVWKKIQ